MNKCDFFPFLVFILPWQMSSSAFYWEPSEHNQKFFTLIASSHFCFRLKWRSRTLGGRGWMSALECVWVCSRWSALSMTDSSSSTRWEEVRGPPWNWEPSSPSLQWEWHAGSVLSAAGHYYCEKDPSPGCPFTCLLNGTLLRAVAT